MPGWIGGFRPLPLSAPQTAETITPDKWLRPFGEPVRNTTRWAAVAAAASGLFAPVLNPDTQITQDFESRWHQPWSEPVRAKPALLAANQQYQVSWSTFTPVTETVTVDKWYVALAEPVRTKPALPAALQRAFETDADPVVSFSWFNSLVDPIVKAKAGLLAANQQYQVSWSIFTPEVVTLDKWYVALTEPVRVKVSLAPAAQQFTAFVKAAPFPEAVFESKWHQPWSEPVRAKPALRVAPDTAMVPFTLPYATVSYGWNVPQTDLPPRAKPGLLAACQQFYTANVFPIANVVVTNYGWFAPLGTPANPKPGLAARYQQAFAAPTRLLPTPNITGVLAASDNPDTAQFGGIVFNAPIEALTGVIELYFSPTLSITEANWTGGISGVVEDARLLASAVVVSPIASAQVSIRLI